MRSLLAIVALTACGDNLVPEVSVQRTWTTAATRSCVMASPVAYEDTIITVAMDGLIQAHARDGALRWSHTIETAAGETPIVLSTPVLHGDVLFVAWQDTVTQEGLPHQGSWRRVRHRVAGFDARTGAPAPAFPPIVLAAALPTHDGGIVTMESRMQLLRGALLILDDRLYVPLGNGPSLQPFHGWLFELELDPWRHAASLVTTAETDCAGDPATMVCGGGVWTPAGPIVAPDGRLIVPTGNGRVDLDRKAYANALMRVSPGLAFDPGCDAALCASFSETAPDPACLASCTDLFIPRMPAGETFALEQGGCEGKTLLECYGEIDGDFGASAPVWLPEEDLIAHVAKDGAMYLIDGTDLGVMHDRRQLIEPCGTPMDPCPARWAGQFVTQPVAVRVDGRLLVIATGFNVDRSHPAGIVAVEVVDASTAPHLEVAWQAPDFTTEAAVTHFREHPGRPVIVDIAGQPHVAVVEVRRDGNLLWIVRAADGVVVARERLTGHGARYSRPLVDGDMLYIGTCTADSSAGGMLEAVRLGRR